MTQNPSESGSVFILIFLAIGLLAALSFAITQGHRSGNIDLSEEQAKIYGTEIISYADTIAKAVQKLRLNGCLETQISFQSPETGTTYQNASAPADETCHVYSFSGGQVLYNAPQAKWMIDSTTSSLWVNAQIAVEGLATDAPELIVWALKLKPQVCDAINELTMGQDAAKDGQTVQATPFGGTYPSALANGIGDDLNSIYIGQTMGCIESTDGTHGSFYRVLIAR